MRFLKLALIAVPVLFLSACGGGSHEESYDYAYDEYIDWSGSVNGTLVVDATDDVFEFEVNTGYLHFGSTTYTNAWVDSYGDFYVDGELIGAVFYVKSIYNETITALISNNGYYIDIYGPESDLAWEEAPTIPIYAFKEAAISKQVEESVYTQLGQQADVKYSEKATPPGINKNAYTEKLPANNQSTLRK